MSLWGCWAADAGEGGGGRRPEHPLSLLVSSCSSWPPGSWAGLSLACVCAAGKGRLRVDFPLSSYMFFCRGLSGSVWPSLRVPVSFPAPLLVPPPHPCPILHLPPLAPTAPTNGKEGQPLSPVRAQWTSGSRLPNRGQIRSSSCATPRGPEGGGRPREGAPRLPLTS